MNELITQINDALWGYVLIGALVAAGLGLPGRPRICGAMHEAFGLDPLLVGVVLSATALVIIFGGIHRIANVSSVLVPLMAIGYFLLAIVIVIMNIEHIPHVMKVIVTNAFGLEQGVGGVLWAPLS